MGPEARRPVPERGEFGAIATSVPGVRFSELLPRSRTIAHKLTVIRSMSHGNANHVQASLKAHDGHGHPPRPRPRRLPALGDRLPAVRRRPEPISRARRRLPTWVQVGPLMRAQQRHRPARPDRPASSGPRCSPLAIDQDLLPANVRDRRRRDRTPSVPSLRLSDRGRLLEQVEAAASPSSIRPPRCGTFDAFHRQAFNLLSSPATGPRFDLAAEPAGRASVYGRREFGQRCLLARRLAEAGVPIDQRAFLPHAERLVGHARPAFPPDEEDRCARPSTRPSPPSWTDLDQRGLLEQTLVLATAEFGRTPRVNTRRRPRPLAMGLSVAMAGGGARPGVVYGASDGIAAHPTVNPHDPRDLAATVYHLLGVPEDTLITTRRIGRIRW